MSVHALLMTLAVMASDTPPAPPPAGAEPLPPGVPTEAYPLTAWCYGAMSEYLDIYDRVTPDLKAIDKMFGSSQPNEAKPYAEDMAAARDELKVLAGAVEAAEKASPSPIAPQGVDAIKLGRSIWAPAEAKTRRELARAWLSWAMPDRCDSTARTLTARSALLGQALKDNNPAPPADTPAPTPAASQSPPVAAEAPAPQAEPTTAAEPPAPVAPPAPPPAPAVTAPAADQTEAPPAPPPAQPDTGSAPLPSPAPYQPPDPNAPIPDAAPQGATPQP